jgi:hypothetical protein
MRKVSGKQYILTTVSCPAVRTDSSYSHVCDIVCAFRWAVPVAYGVRGSVVVKALCYKPEGRGFDSR